MNRGEEANDFILKSDLVNLEKSVKIRDLWSGKKIGAIGKKVSFTIPKHGIVVLRTE